MPPPTRSGHHSSLQRRLDNQSLKAVLEDGPQSALQQSYRQIQQHWNQELRPAIERDDGALFRGGSAPAFVEQLNQFVSLLQQQSEHKQGWQQLIQGLALFNADHPAALELYELQYGVVTPLKELVDATRRFREGDYPDPGQSPLPKDELGQLAP